MFSLNAVLKRSSHRGFFNSVALEHFIVVTSTGLLNMQREVDSTVRKLLN